jgi:putative SOS response-associated peptidase YedK
MNDLIDPSVGNRMINARAETVSTKPSFRKAFKNHRCLVLADGFYEWQKTANGKQPYYIRMEDDSPFAFAGLWESWQNGKEIRSATIITTDANDVVAPIHDRILWLDPDFEEKEPLTLLLEAYPAETMEAYPVSRSVNSPSNNEPSIIESVA